jgi:hypothetical protein
MAKKPTISPTDFEDRRVLSVPEFRERNKISKTQWFRLKQAGKTPRTVRLSAQREGVRLCDERAWQEARLSA